MKKRQNACMKKNSLHTRSIIILVLATSLFPTEWANAYELATHARLTYKAFSFSRLLSDPTLIADLGLDISSRNIFGDSYIDINGNTVITRSANPFESAFMLDKANPPVIPLGTSPLSLPGWLMRGAIREDDYLGGRNPYLTDPDKPFPFIRVFNHFFDPVNRRGLTIGSVAFGDMAPQ